MPMPEGLAELLLEELNRPALVFCGRRVAAINQLATSLLGLPAASVAEQPCIVLESEWPAIESVLRRAEESGVAVSDISIKNTTCSVRCVTKPSLQKHVVCILTPAASGSPSGAPFCNGPVLGDGEIVDERVRSRCVRDLFERTKIWYGTDEPSWF